MEPMCACGGGPAPPPLPPAGGTLRRRCRWPRPRPPGLKKPPGTEAPLPYTAPPVPSPPPASGVSGTSGGGGEGRAGGCGAGPRPRVLSGFEGRGSQSRVGLGAGVGEKKGWGRGCELSLEKPVGKVGRASSAHQRWGEVWNQLFRCCVPGGAWRD